MPFFSIITVNKNNWAGLRLTIESVVNQKYKDFDFLIIDGKSEDKSLEVIKKHEKDIDYWVSEIDNGIYHAMNKGIKTAKGTYCLFLNSGDFLFNDKVLEDTYNELKNNPVDIYSGNVMRFSGKNSKTEVFAKIKSSNISFYDLYKYSLNHQATFIKRDLFDSIGLYDESMAILSDWLFYTKAIMFHNASFKYKDAIIAYYEADGISSGSHNEILKTEKEKCFNILLPEMVLKDYLAMQENEEIANYKIILKYRLTRFVLRALAFLIKCFEKLLLKTKPKSIMGYDHF